MTIGSHIESFAGYPAVDWPSEGGEDPRQTLYRIGLSWEDYDSGKSWLDYFADFLATPLAAQTPGIVVGSWGFEGSGSGPAIEALVAARDQLPNLIAIFFGDITYEENEISWIEQDDVSPLFLAYPQMTHFAVRGGNGLGLGPVQHENLRKLIVQTGGLRGAIVRSILESRLPALEHLELWLGTEYYGATTTIDDLRPLLDGEVFPNLTHLGLRDSDLADEIAKALKGASILERIEALDLSMGTIGDEGGRALLENPAIAHLNLLDLHHNYFSDEMLARLRELPVDEIDLSEVENEDEYGRYVAVGE